MFFIVRLNDSFNFPLGWIKYIVIVVVIVVLPAPPPPSTPPPPTHKVGVGVYIALTLSTCLSFCSFRFVCCTVWSSPWLNCAFCAFFVCVCRSFLSSPCVPSHPALSWAWAAWCPLAPSSCWTRFTTQVSVLLFPQWIARIDKCE